MRLESEPLKRVDGPNNRDADNQLPRHQEQGRNSGRRHDGREPGGQ